MEFSSWKFSNIQATILGSARELPFKVCAKLLDPLLSILNLSLFDWKVSKFETELTSRHFFWAAE